MKTTTMFDQFAQQRQPKKPGFAAQFYEQRPKTLQEAFTQKTAQPAIGQVRPPGQPPALPMQPLQKPIAPPKPQPDLGIALRLAQQPLPSQTKPQPISFGLGKLFAQQQPTQTGGTGGGIGSTTTGSNATTIGGNPNPDGGQGGGLGAVSGATTGNTDAGSTQDEVEAERAEYYAEHPAESPDPQNKYVGATLPDGSPDPRGEKDENGMPTAEAWAAMSQEEREAFMNWWLTGQGRAFTKAGEILQEASDIGGVTGAGIDAGNAAKVNEYLNNLGKNPAYDPSTGKSAAESAEDAYNMAVGNAMSMTKNEVGGEKSLDQIGIDPTAYNQVGYDENKTALAAQLAAAQEQQSGMNAQQQGLIDMLRMQAEGGGPSVAQQQLIAGRDAAIRAAAAQAASTPGLAPGLAARQAGLSAENLQASTNAQMAQLRAQEMQSAQQGLGQALTQAQQAQITQEQLVQQFLQMGYSLDEAQTQAQLAYQELLMTKYQTDRGMSLQEQNAANAQGNYEQNRKDSIWGSVIKGGASLLEKGVEAFGG